MEAEMRKTGSTTWNGLQVEYSISVGDWEGDPDVPGGVNKFPPYIDELIILSPDGEDIADLFCDNAIDNLEIEILEGHK
jgi:hypothetical protein